MHESMLDLSLFMYIKLYVNKIYSQVYHAPITLHKFLKEKSAYYMRDDTVFIF